MSSASRLLLSPLLIARVQPRVGSVLAIPTLKQDLIQNKTPEGVCVVRVPYMRYNEYLVKHFHNYEEMWAAEEDSGAEEGDIVLLKRLEKRIHKDITFRVDRVLHKLGDITDPITGKEVYVERYREDMEREAQLYGRHGEANFDHSKARPRGWQRGKKDFGDCVTYNKWHVMRSKKALEEDKYSIS